MSLLFYTLQNYKEKALDLVERFDLGFAPVLNGKTEDYCNK